MTTVLTLGGLNYGRIDRLDTALQGYATKRGRVIVDYPQAANAESILTGEQQLDRHARALVKANQPFEIVASSMGAEVVSLWLENNADKPDAPSPALLQRIILLGNPCRREGGVVTAGNWITKIGYLGRRRPTPETQYRTDDIAREGDYWANADGYPTGKRPRLSLLRILLGLDPHTDYDDVDPERPGVLRARSGNTCYWVAG